ncbi:unnamed protein product [Moneuplotes crassus]|uniref:Uncharacterized protein n=1 Tax=Euplotes crassus TaxID=5936 RepID=A0AAD1U0D4_EUPCR|nr:unnamed protein product [Moneuplotes crassus]
MKRRSLKDVGLTKDDQKGLIPLSITKKAISPKKREPRIRGKAIELLSDPKIPSQKKRTRTKLTKSRNANLKESRTEGDKTRKKKIEVEETNESKFQAHKEKDKSNPTRLHSGLEETKKDKQLVDNESPRRNIIEVKMDFEFLKNQQSKRTIFTKNRGSARSFDMNTAVDNLKELFNTEDEIQRSTTQLKIQLKAQGQKVTIKTGQPAPQLVNKDPSLDENESNSPLLKKPKQEATFLQEEQKSQKSAENVEQNKADHASHDMQQDYLEEEINPEFMIINQIYEKAHQKQKLPYKKIANRQKTKYFRLIPKNPMMRSEAQKVDPGIIISPEEKRYKNKIEKTYQRRLIDKREKTIKMLNEKVRGSIESPNNYSYAKQNENPIFRNLGIGIRDCKNNSVLMSPKDREEIDIRLNKSGANLETKPQSEIFRCRGISYDSGVPLSTKYPSINYNRFGYLYNFSKEKSLEPAVNQDKKRKNLTEKVSLDNFYEEPDVPTIQQIINNPCIFNIRDKLMTGKLSESKKPLLTASQEETKEYLRVNYEDGHRKNHSLRGDSNQKGIKNILMDRNIKLPEKMPERLKDKYLHKLVGDKDFFPQLVHKNDNDESSQDNFADIFQNKDKSNRRGKNINRKLNYSAAFKVYTKKPEINPNMKFL